jgi:hypothetical protein
MQSQADRPGGRTVRQQHIEQAADLARSRLADGVADRHLHAAHVEERLHHGKHLGWRDRPLEWAVKGGGDVATDRHCRIAEDGPESIE